MKFGNLVLWCGVGLILAMVTPALAHFGVVIPSSSTVMDRDKAQLELEVAFAHPASGQGMSMERPEKFFVSENGQARSLEEELSPILFMGKEAWKCEYSIKSPGVYQFAVVPKPYYEAAEDIYIIHYAKTVTAAYGAEAGWEKPLGLPVEIVPLSRPFGNYAGNVFQGLVLHDGKPVSGALVEVEYLDKTGQYVAPDAYYETQTTHADENGVFVFGIPWPGWWGFAALVEVDQKIVRDNQPKSVELGGIIWTEYAAPVRRQ